MRTRLQRMTAILCGIMLAVSALGSVSAATYPYDVQSADSVNLRRSASSSSTILAYISQGDTVTLLGETGSYYKVQFGDIVGYAIKKYINGESLTEDPEYIQSLLSSVSEYPYQTTTTARVNMRKSASATASVVQIVPENAIITVKSVTNNEYAKAEYKDVTGYISTDYINLSPIPTPTPVPEPTIDPNAEKYPTLENGDTGTFVTALQEALTELKYYKSEVDGKYGAGTQSAVQTFEKRNGLTIDGIADQELLYLMFEGTPKNYYGYRKDVSVIPPIYGVTMEYGDKGELVKTLQERLQALGYYDGDITRYV